MTKNEVFIDMNRKFLLTVIVVVLFVSPILLLIEQHSTDSNKYSVSDIIIEKGMTIHYADNGSNVLAPNFGAVMDLYPVKTISSATLTGSWKSTAPMALIVIPTSQLKNDTLIMNLLDRAGLSLYGSLNVALPPAEFGYTIEFAPAANSSGTYTITDAFVLSAIS